MLCYRDRCYCGNEKCKNYEKCKQTYKTAKEEKSKSIDPFIRDTIGIAVRFGDTCMITGEKYEKA